ncbi:MAG: ABC transporter substrate-binding protein [Alphaproteobacteria bacterium]|nr:MAG: ABC transporter substrate-binding protein [Alphaproteobacteria bacterium]
MTPGSQSHRTSLGRAIAFLALVFGLAVLAGGGARAEDVIRSHGISTFGDLKYPADFDHFDYVNPDAPKWGELSIWAFGGFDSMNPYTIKGRAGALSSIFYESLLEGSADEPDSLYGLVAESLEYPPSKDWVIFNLRPEARFSDGSPLTAEDVLFSYETFRDKGLSSFRAVMNKMVAGAEVLGPHRIRFSFKADAPRREVIQTVGGLPIFSKADFERRNIDFEETTLEPFLGSAPYVLERMEVGQTLVYKRNPDYWGKDLPINRGRWNFDRIRVEYYADYNSAFEGFKGGTYHFRNEAASLIWATGYDFPAVKNGWVRKDTPPDGTLASGQSFVMNLRRDRFSDPKVREAIGLMFNFEWSNKTLFYGLYKRINSFWENSDLAATGKPDAEELAILEPLAPLLPEGVLTEDAVMAPVSNPDRQLDRRNLRKASRLLDEAGWVVGDDGIRRKDGVVLTLEILNDSPTFDRVMLPYVENLRRLGIDARLTRVDNAQMESRTRSYDFDMVVGTFPMSLTPGAGLEQYFGSENANRDVFNLMGLQSEGVDRLIEVVKNATTRHELDVSVRALDRVLRAYRFWVPHWYKPVHTLAYYDYYEHPDPLPPYSLGQFDLWWANKDKYEALRAAGAF